MGRSTSVTIRDVAKAAGVSPSTVSRALTAEGPVNEQTRQRILQVAQRLNYLPDPAARRLITGRSGNIGLVVPDLGNPFFADIAKGVQHRIREQDCALFISDSDEKVRYELGAVHQLARQVDGLIMGSPRMADDDLMELAREVPMVLLHRMVDGLPSVVADWADGMRQAVENLYALGHRVIAYAAGPKASWSSERRMEGLRAVTDDYGCQLIELGNVAPNYDGGLAAADLFLATPATALIGYNDSVCFGVLSRLRQRGVQVPDDVSVVGCDNVRMSAMTNPQLTTVSVPRAEAGGAAVDMLKRLLNGDENDEIEHRVLPTQLVVRGTTSVATTPHP